MPTEESELTTDEVTVNGDKQRVYTNGNSNWPSVSTVLDSRDTPEKDESLQSWRKYMYASDYRPDPDELLRYRGARGTLAHYKALNPLVAYELASEDESRAYDSLRDWEYRHSDALRTAKDDIEFFLDAWRDMAEARGIAHFDSDGNVIEERVRAIEKAVLDREHQYAGRFDLAYEHPERGTVVADLKTSNARSMDHLFEKKWPRYGLQIAAYAQAVEFDVDAVEVLWASPETESYSVITEDDMPLSRSGYERRFLELAHKFHRETQQ
jgi:hypothetical protein